MNNMRASDRLLNLEGKYLEASRDCEGNVMVCYRNADIKKGVGLLGVCGRGRTLEEACENYLELISGKTLVFNAFDNREEVFVL